MNLCLKLSHIPKDMSSATLCPIFKKGNQSDLSNYRPISIITSFQKVLSHLINRRIRDKAEEMISPYQSGFIRKRGCLDNIQILNYYKRDKPFLLFIDLTKAFDSVNRNKLINISKEWFGKNKISNLIQEMYSD